VERASEPSRLPEGFADRHVDHDGLEHTAFWADYWDDHLVGTPLYYLPHLRALPERTSAVLSAIATAPEGAVLFHCAGGRDRTGLACAFLLRLAGVDPVVIAEDHALSDDSFGPYNEEWVASAPDEEERAIRRRISVRAERTMVDVLEEVERRHGGVEEYLAGGGVHEEELDLARERLAP
jgi:hypothetical protein